MAAASPPFGEGLRPPRFFGLGAGGGAEDDEAPPEPEAATGGTGTPFEDSRGAGPARGGAGLLASSCSAFHSATALRLAPALNNFQCSGGMLGGRDDPERTRVHRPYSNTHPGLPANFAVGCSGSHPISPTSTTFSGMYATSAKGKKLVPSHNPLPTSEALTTSSRQSVCSSTTGGP